jgi:predicted  nucleic acid-binding Zn-ribbon protein
MTMEDLKSLEDLLDLQSVDSEIDQLLDRRTNLPELKAFRTAHDELARIEGQLAGMASRIREIDLATDKSDGELKIEEIKAHREEQRLYAGGLSARDAEHLRNEVQMLQRQISEHEDQLLALMEEKDGLEAAAESLSAERDAVSAEKGRIEQVVAASWSVIDDDVARLESRKSALNPLIDPDLIALYEEIRPTKEGVAVARLGEGVCGGCHLTLSAAEQVQAGKAQPPRCIHCWRILVLQ